MQLCKNVHRPLNLDWLADEASLRTRGVVVLELPEPKPGFKARSKLFHFVGQRAQHQIVYVLNYKRVQFSCTLTVQPQTRIQQILDESDLCEDSQGSVYWVSAHHFVRVFCRPGRENEQLRKKKNLMFAPRSAQVKHKLLAAVRGTSIRHCRTQHICWHRACHSQHEITHLSTKFCGRRDRRHFAFCCKEACSVN